jgi:serine/threonine-protein kinase
VGVILYEVLSGRAVYDCESTMDLLVAHATEAPLPFRRSDADPLVPKEVEDVVLACLEKDPAKRPASARELAERFQVALTAESREPEETLSDGDSASQPTGLPGHVRQTASPDAASYHLDAWMPEAIAVHKLRGFIYDAGGSVVESVPGHVIVHLGGPGSVYSFRKRGAFRLFRGKESGLLEITLSMAHSDPDRRNLLDIMVEMRSLDGASPLDPEWRAYTAQIFCDLRGYLMGQTGVVQQVS